MEKGAVGNLCMAVSFTVCGPKWPGQALMVAVASGVHEVPGRADAQVLDVTFKPNSCGTTHAEWACWHIPRV